MNALNAARAAFRAASMIVIVLTFLSAPAFAAAGVHGTIVDADGPVIGAIVELLPDGQTSGKAVVTGVDGGFLFKDVAPGSYKVRAAFSGGDPVVSPTFVVKAGTTFELSPLSLAIETVEVQASATDVQQKGNTTSGETFQAEKLAYLPSARSYTELLKIAPGVSEDTGGADRTGAPAGVSVYGSSAQESSYIIDGINTTSIDTGRPSTNINYDLIDKIEIKTGGYNAEFGGAQGAVVNVETKTGGNLFEGSVNLYLSPEALAATPETNGLGAQRPTPNDREVSGTIGGPIVKDKLFFFAAIAQKNYTGVSPQSYLNLLNAPGQPATGRVVAEDTERTSLYSFKSTWQITPNHRLTASYFSDPRVGDFRDELGGYGGDYRQTNTGSSASLRLESILATRWVFRAGAGLHREGEQTLPTIDRQAANPVGENRRLSYQSIKVRIADALPSDSTASLASRDVSLKVGPYAYSGETDGNRQFLKTSIEGAFRHHTPKFGLEYEPSSFDQSLDYGWGTGISLEWDEATQDPSRPEQIVGVRRCWGDGNGNCLDWQHQIRAKAKTTSIRAYAQDQWQPTDNLAFNYGVRWEAQSVANDAGATLITMNKNIAPRLGFTWDILGGGKSKLYGSAGRYYDTAPLQVMSRAFAPRITQERLFRTRNWDYLNTIASFNVGPEQSGNGLCATNTAADDFGTLVCWDFESADFISNPQKTTGFVDKVYTPRGLLNSGNPRDLFRPEVIVTSGSLNASPIDPTLKGASTDEVMIGYEWEFKPHWRVGAKMIGRKLNEAIEDLSLDLGQTFIIANPGGPYHFYVDPGNPDLWNPDYDPTSTAYAARPGLAQLYGCKSGTTCTVTNAQMRQLGYGAVPKAERIFKGYELTLTKELTKKFWFGFSYLHSSTTGNYRGRYFVETEERDPNQTEAFDVPALAINTYGKLPQDRPEQVKLYGSYRLTDDISLSASARYLSGTPIDATTDPLGGSTPFLGPIYLMPRGSAGRTPSLKNLDLGLAYDIHDSKKIKMTVMLDVFNVLNEQNAVAVDSQFLGVGVWRQPFYDSVFGYIYGTEGRGEPLVEYVDTKFGNANGVLTPDEWNRWAGSFEGRFTSLQQLYHFLRTETVPLTIDGTVRDVPAYPGFQNCPQNLPTDFTKCPALNARYGQSTQIETPRSIRFGFRLTF